MWYYRGATEFQGLGDSMSKVISTYTGVKIKYSITLLVTLVTQSHDPLSGDMGLKVQPPFV